MQKVFWIGNSKNFPMYRFDESLIPNRWRKNDARINLPVVANSNSYILVSDVRDVNSISKNSNLLLIKQLMKQIIRQHSDSLKN